MSAMLKAFFLSALFLVVGGLLAYLMALDPGVMMLSWNSWLIETTFWTAIGLLLALVALLLLLGNLLRRLAPTRLWREFRKFRDQRTARKATLVAVQSWLSRDEDQAIKSLQQVAAAGGSERLPSAISLALGLHQADWHERYAALIKKDPELKIFADVLLAERLWQVGQQQSFIELMRSRFDLRQIPWLRERLWQLMISADQAADLLPMINEATHIQPDARRDWLERSARAALLQLSGKKEGARLLGPLSKEQRSLPAVLAAEVQYLISINEHEQAFKRAKQLLNRDGQYEKAQLLLEINVSNQQKLNFLQASPPSKPGPVLCRTLGMLNMQEKLWGQAQNWLEQAWQQGDVTAAIQLAKLMEQRDRPSEASRLYRELAHKVAEPTLQ